MQNFNQGVPDEYQQQYLDDMPQQYNPPQQFAPQPQSYMQRPPPVQPPAG